MKWVYETCSPRVPDVIWAHNLAEGSRLHGWGPLSQFCPLVIFPIIQSYQNTGYLMEYHVHIWQISPQLRWGNNCMCSTDPFMSRWSRGYICNSSFYQHDIGGIKSNISIQIVTHALFKRVLKIVFFDQICSIDILVDFLMCVFIA